MTLELLRTPVDSNCAHQQYVSALLSGFVHVGSRMESITNTDLNTSLHFITHKRRTSFREVDTTQTNKNKNIKQEDN